MTACLTLHKGEPFRYIAALLTFGTPSKDSRHSWMRTVPTAMFECTQVIPSSSLANLPSLLGPILVLFSFSENVLLQFQPVSVAQSAVTLSVLFSE